MNLVQKSLLAAIGLVSFIGCSIAQDEVWKPETGIAFNGNDQYMIVEEAQPFNVNEFTVEAWVRYEDPNANQIFMNRGAAAEEFTFYSYNQRIRMLVQDEQGYSHADEELPPAGTWFHCVGTYSEDGTKRLYYNGKMVAQKSGLGRPLSGNDPLYIGALPGGGLAPMERFFGGEMENLRFWTRALSRNEVQTLVRTSPEEGDIEAMKEEGLLAYWSSRSQEGQTYVDMTGNGLDAKFKQYTQDENVVVQTERDTGYKGIWYSNQPSDDKYRYKYSGGLGTYCAKHRHHLQYAPEVNKTFFVYGGTKGLGESKPLLMMISYYDHETDEVPRPAILMEKGTADAHHNPVLCIDDQGFLWVFASAHGGKDGFIWKSTEPYSIDEFELVMQREFTYPQPRFIPEHGFMFLFTKYTAGRELYASTSEDGRTWSSDTKISGFGGHYQISTQEGPHCGTSFNWHPPVGGLNARTNLYYMETRDFGKTWTNIQGEELELPLSDEDNPALVRDYHSEGLLVYMKDIDFDEDGHPVIMYTLSKGYESGPENDPRIMTIARWDGEQWAYHEVCETDHNYDMGSLYIHDSDRWQVIAPVKPGPQEYCTGGEVVLLESRDQGSTWKEVRPLTKNSKRNHTYVRRALNPHPDFYALWADGDALKPSESNLYYTNQNGDHVWILPEEMEEDYAQPRTIETSRVKINLKMN